MSASLTDPFGRVFNVGDIVYACRQSSYGGGSIFKVVEIKNKKLKLWHPTGKSRFTSTSYEYKKYPYSFWKEHNEVVKAPEGYVPDEAFSSRQ